MLRFRTFINVLKRSSAYQLTITRGHQNRRGHERPDDAQKKRLFDKQQRQEKKAEARTSAESVVKQNFFFTHEKNMEFAKSMIAYNRVMGAIYFVTVKESKAQFEALYGKAGRKNLNSIRSIGAHSKVDYEVDPADAAKIKLFTNSEKLDRIFYIDPSQEANMIGFLKMCSEMLKEGGQIHMIVEASVFQLLDVEELARTVKIFIKEQAKFFEGYCKGFTLTHVNATEAMIYKLELDTSRKVESERSSEVNPSVGQWNMMYLVCETELQLLSQHVQLHYFESGRRSSEVDPSVAKGNMTDLVCTSLEEKHVPRETLVLPGSVVDTTNFCHPSEFDLYLSSHAGIQDTNRPTHTLAENKFNADGLQIVTKTSCYMYARSTSSDSVGGMPVASIVRRAYYAHPAAVIPMVSVQQ